MASERTSKFWRNQHAGADRSIGELTLRSKKHAFRNEKGSPNILARNSLNMSFSSGDSEDDSNNSQRVS